MTRKTLPVRTILTNRRDTESDLGGVQLVKLRPSEDRPQSPPARNADKPC